MPSVRSLREGCACLAVAGLGRFRAHVWDQTERATGHGSRTLQGRNGDGFLGETQACRGDSSDHYAWFYTREFGLTQQDDVGKRVLDIGCGPRGSLKWAEGATDRIGVDPLVEGCRTPRIDEHAMRYVASGAESIPFPDGHFEIVATFNSLDHVDNVDAAIRERDSLYDLKGSVW
jgi:SAM-dependent methyltransferase